MSSRGAVIRNGHVTTEEYTTLKDIYDASILIGVNGHHGLPDFSHSPNRIYIKENPDGSFRELRVYDEEHYPILEIGYHGEESLTGNRHVPVLHYHYFDKDLNRYMGGKISLTDNPDIYTKFKKYLEGYGL